MWKTTIVDNNYEVSTEGLIREKKTKTLVNQWKGSDGYLIVSLSNKLYRAHRVVALTFIENPNNYPVVNHKDYDRTNNHVSNLEWTSHSQNTQHSFLSGRRENTVREWATKVQPLGANASKTRVAQYDLQGNLLNVYNSQREASEATGTCRSCITNCVRGKNKTVGGFIWKYCPESSTTKREENPASPVQDSGLPDEDIV